MIVGVPREIKEDEYRVAMLPVGVDLLVQAGHQVLIEGNSGDGSGYDDQQYAAVGATIVDSHGELFEKAELIVKVKEPINEELSMLRRGQIVFTYFHFAASRHTTTRCLEAGIAAG